MLKFAWRVGLVLISVMLIQSHNIGFNVHPAPKLRIRFPHNISHCGVCSGPVLPKLLFIPQQGIQESDIDVEVLVKLQDSLAVHAGPVDIRIIDFCHHNNTNLVSLCQHQENIVTYQSHMCQYEIGNGSFIKFNPYYYPLNQQNPFLRNRTRTFLHSGNGYDVRLVGPSVVWGGADFLPADGSYHAHLRVDDPGTYRAIVYRNSVGGCGLVDCDVPGQICKPFWMIHSNSIFGACGNRTSSPCKTLVLEQDVTILPSGSGGAATTQAPFPRCKSSDIGSVRGRWIKPAVIKPFLVARNLTVFGSEDDAYVWQPYDCWIEWLSPQQIQSCLSSAVGSDDNDNLNSTTKIPAKQFLFLGTSRERTLYYDFLNWMDPVAVGRSRLQASKLPLSHENLYFSNAIYPQRFDAVHWNSNGGEMQAWPQEINEFLKEQKLCRHSSQPTSSSSPQLHVYLCLEEMRLADNALEEVWDNITTNFLLFMRSKCPEATLHFATSPAVARDEGSLSWQRMLWLSRRSKAIASRDFGLDIIDAFSLTLPLAYDPAVYVDGTHLFEKPNSFLGNHVSKTIAMLFLQQTCDQD